MKLGGPGSTQRPGLPHPVIRMPHRAIAVTLDCFPVPARLCGANHREIAPAASAEYRGALRQARGTCGPALIRVAAWLVLPMLNPVSEE